MRSSIVVVISFISFLSDSEARNLDLTSTIPPSSDLKHFPFIPNFENFPHLPTFFNLSSFLDFVTALGHPHSPPPRPTTAVTEVGEAEAEDTTPIVQELLKNGPTFFSSLNSSRNNTMQSTTSRSLTISPGKVLGRELPNDMCGKPLSLPTATPNVRIVNGAVVPLGGMPWTCAMVQAPKFQFCDCTVISNQWVVTAGHCVASSTEEKMKASVKIYAGSSDLRNATVERNIFAISRVILHPQHNAKAHNNDVALIKLATPIVNFSSTLLPACLPNLPITAQATQTGAKGRRICYVAGWGLKSENQTVGRGQIGAGSDRLLQVAIEMYSAADCRTFAGVNFNATTMVCGGYDDGRYDACQGDSGGPLVCDAGDGTWALHGIVSFGKGCANAGKPGVYTNVHNFAPFIRQTIAAN